MTITSAIVEKAEKENTGMNICSTISDARPIRGAARNMPLLAAAGTMVSLPQSLKKS